jgi:hypothetical protein
VIILWSHLGSAAFQGTWTPPPPPPPPYLAHCRIQSAAYQVLQAPVGVRFSGGCVQQWWACARRAAWAGGAWARRCIPLSAPAACPGCGASPKHRFPSCNIGQGVSFLLKGSASTRMDSVCAQYGCCFQMNLTASSSNNLREHLFKVSVGHAERGGELVFSPSQNVMRISDSCRHQFDRNPRKQPPQAYKGLPCLQGRAPYHSVHAHVRAL